MNLGALTPGNQYYNASGEATPEAKLPTEFQSMNVASSARVAVNRVPPEWMPDLRRTPIVQRRERMNGIWHLYSRAMQRQPYNRLGQPGGQPPRPNISGFQPNDMGPIRNGGFNDALYQAGYPGFNLGLSFKVQPLPTQGGPRSNMDQGGPQTISQLRKVSKIRRSSGAPPRG
jgi:hypothetical protein